MPLWSRDGGGAEAGARFGLVALWEDQAQVAEGPRVAALRGVRAPLGITHNAPTSCWGAGQYFKLEITTQRNQNFYNNDDNRIFNNIYTIMKRSLSYLYRWYIKQRIKVKFINYRI